MIIIRAKPPDRSGIPICMEEIAPNLAVIPMLIANAYLVGDARSWVLIDSGTPGNAGKIKAAAEERFGENARPRAIVLTHGHFDHAGSSKDLADIWNVKVYAHRLERPYLQGAAYPPPDPTAPGAFAFISRVFPVRTVDLGDRFVELPRNLAELALNEWEIIDTPGHTPGHVSFFRRSDASLVAGDALTTMNVDDLMDLITKRQQVCRPPTPATTDWKQARESVLTLAALHPNLIAAGHGIPMRSASGELNQLAHNFPTPSHGRYACKPALADETGVTYLPPKPPDNVARVTIGVASAAALAGVGLLLLRKPASS